MQDLGDEQEGLPAQEVGRLILFSVGGEWFALPIEEVKEIHPLGRITRVPNAPRGVLGITNLRGKVLTLCDLQACRGAPVGPKGEGAQVIVLDLDPELDVGIVVDGIGSIRAVPSEGLEAPFSSQSSSTAPLKGIVHVEEEAAGLLDLKRLFAQVILDL